MPVLEGVRFCFADTSFFYATLDSRDRDHSAAKRLASLIRSRGIATVTTWEIIMETVTLLRYRYSFQGAMAFVNMVLPRLNIVYASADERVEALAVFGRLGRDRRLSLCDALSYVIVRRLGFPPCLAFDEDFAALGLTLVRDSTT